MKLNRKKEQKFLILDFQHANERLRPLLEDNWKVKDFRLEDLHVGVLLERSLPLTIDEIEHIEAELENMFKLTGYSK